jgi:hypothetical protein
MSRKAFQVIFLGLITLGTTSANADEIKQWVQARDTNVSTGAVAGGIVAAGSLAIGAQFAKSEIALSRTYSRLGDMNESSTFKKAAGPFIQERDKINQIMAPFIKAQNEDKLRLEAVCKNQECQSGVAMGLQRDIQNRQSVINKFQFRLSEFNNKIDDVHHYLASSGRATTSLSSAERKRLDSFIEGYQREFKTSILLKNEAANYEKRAEKSALAGAVGAVIAVPAVSGATLAGEMLSQRAIANGRDKAQAEFHVTTVHRAPDAASTNAEAK